MGAGESHDEVVSGSSCYVSFTGYHTPMICLPVFVCSRGGIKRRHIALSKHLPILICFVYL